MRKEKPVEVFHFHNGRDGGVWSVIRNLITYHSHPCIHNHVVQYIEEGKKLDINAKNLPEGVDQQVFYYSPKNNFYFTCRNLAKLLPDSDAVIVAHNWLELGMVSQLGLSNPLIYYAHGNYAYYFDLAERHCNAIDAVVAVAGSIADGVRQRIPEKKDQISYIRFPVPPAAEAMPKLSGSIAFVGRLSDVKGYDVLLKIARETATVPNLQWHIVGAGDSEWLAKNPWPGNISHIHYGEISNDAVRQLLAKMEILILPSLREGMPNVVIEAMKAGVVPVVSDIPGGMQELVIDEETGYRVNQADVGEYGKHIARLQDPGIRTRLANNAKTLADAMFNPVENCRQFENLVVDVSNMLKRKKQPVKIYGSRLDQPWLPNFLVRGIRTIC